VRERVYEGVNVTVELVEGVPDVIVESKGVEVTEGLVT